MFDIGDTEATAIEGLWREHAARLVRFATVLVGPVDAHDVVVEAFMGAARAVGSSEVHNPRAYLLRAVANRANDLHRASRRRWARDLAAIGPAASGAPDTFVDVRRAVASLSVGQRAVVYFVYWEDLTERDVAALLDISPGTVRRHLTRARAHLRKALQ